MDDQPSESAMGFSALRRSVAFVVLISGAIACYLWTRHVLTNGPMWMLGLCALAWCLHSLLVWRLWRAP
jgi:hypothetical protein